MDKVKYHRNMPYEEAAKYASRKMLVIDPEDVAHFIELIGERQWDDGYATGFDTAGYCQ